jgi:hypothetical protein
MAAAAVIRSPTRAAWVLGIVLFASYAYFYQAGGWNQNSRFALVRAILEHHRLLIDDYQLHTGDRALWQGHYYSDKPPATSLMVLPPVQAARMISRAAGVDPGSFPGIAWTSYVAAIASAGLFTVLAALLVFRLSIQWGYSTTAALFAATAYGLASPAWSFATLFMSHGVTAGCLMLAFYGAIRIRDADPESRARAAAAVGFGCGWAVVSEFQAAIPAAVFFGIAIARLHEVDRPRFWSLSAVAVGCAGLCALVLFAYNTRAFGSPLHLGYSSEEGFEQLRTGFFGITYPEWWRLRELLVGGYRGLLPLSPLAAVAPIGLVMIARDRRRRVAALTALGVASYYLLLNASYYYWEGGWSYAPRQLTPGLPFIALGLAPLWDARGPVMRAALAAAWMWGVALTVIAVSTNPQPPSSFKVPMKEVLWPAFRAGDLSLNTQTFVHRTPPTDMGRASWNLGELMGLRGHASLVPLAAIWITGVLVLLL